MFIQRAQEGSRFITNTFTFIYIYLLFTFIGVLKAVTNNMYFSNLIFFNVYKSVASTNSTEHVLSMDKDRGKP